ncbi:MAG: alpha/beta hydrolase family protein [Alphaproteobacteria bacterium]
MKCIIKNSAWQFRIPSLALSLILAACNLINQQISHKLSHHLIEHIDDNFKKVEFCHMMPNTKKSDFAVIFLHGHQYPERPGAKIPLDKGILNEFASQGYNAIAISIAGYGRSDGPADFSGPYSQNAVISVIKYLQSHNIKNIALIGVSRGAIIASMVATKEIGLSCMVLDAGFYDLAKLTDERTIGNLKKEASHEYNYLVNRSAIRHIDKIKTPALILHGYNDERASVEEAIEFYRKLMENKVEAQILIFSSGHHTPEKETKTLRNLFLKKCFNFTS